MLSISIGSTQSARRQSVVRSCQQVMSIEHKFNADAVDSRLLLYSADILLPRYTRIVCKYKICKNRQLLALLRQC